MWRCGSSKQRLWLGAGRYFRRGGRRRYTDANAHCYSDSDRYSDGQSYCYADGDSHADSDRHANGQPTATASATRHAATDANTQSGAIRKAAPNAFAQAIAFHRRKISHKRSPGQAVLVEGAATGIPRCAPSSDVTVASPRANCE